MSRNPKERDRPYDRTEPQPLGEVLSQLIAQRGYGRVQGNRQLEEAWEHAAGSEVASQTKVAQIKNGVLHVGVSNSAMISELTAFLKGDILAKLQSKHSHLKIRDIKFKLRSRLSR